MEVNGCFSDSSLFVVYFQAFAAFCWFLQQLDLSAIEKWETIKTVLWKEDNVITITYIEQFFWHSLINTYQAQTSNYAWYIF